MTKSPSSNLLAPFEALINRCIAQDVKLADGIASHSGKSLQVEVTTPSISILIHFYPSSVLLTFADEQKTGAHDPSASDDISQPWATDQVSKSTEYSRSSANSDSQHAAAEGKIRGSALAMLGLLTERKDRRALVNPNIEISGDSEFVQGIYQLFLEMEIDWQEPLSQLIGDIPTQGIEQLVNGLRNLTLGAAASLKRNVDEYLHEESSLVPPLSRIESFDQDLDSLRLRLDRLQARIQLLAAKLADLSGEQSANLGEHGSATAPGQSADRDGTTIG